MSNIKKRERASNFEKSEIDLLTELVTKYKGILENKRTDAVTNKEKDAAWNSIATSFNAVSSGHTVRTAKNLRLKYEGLKKNTKKKMTMHRQELYRTGGGPSGAPAFSDVEEKVLAICSNISGLDARNDCDFIPDIAETEKDKENFNVSLNGVTVETADILLSSMEEIPECQKNLQIEEVIEEADDNYGTQNIKIDLNDSAHDHEVLQDCQNKWSTWNPKALKSKTSQVLKPSKASVTSKLDQLSTARLELVQLQKEIANKEHLFVKEEHELKMMHLRNEEARKLQLHELMLLAMQRKKSD